MDWHNLNYRDVMEKFGTKESGIASREVKKLENKYGKNTLIQEARPSLLKRFLEQFSDFMVLILLAACGVSFITAIIDGSGNYADPIIILSIVVFNSIIGAMQESKAEKALDSLKKLSAPYAKVIRDEKQKNIPSDKVLPGDILVVEAGDSVCADARLIEAHNLKTEESSLTGESSAVKKSAAVNLPKDTPIAERKNMIFASSSVVSGHAKAIVVETGMNTQVGKIAGLINEGQKPQTPLQQKLAKTGKILGIWIIIISFVIFVLGMLQGIEPLEMFMIAISLAVAAIPEGLPAVVTIVLAIGVRRMASHNAIVRRLPAVETLGSANVICSDKTGTLTQNKMSVTEIRSIHGAEKITSSLSSEILEYCALCNNSRLIEQNKGIIDGEPTENALLLAAQQNGKNKKDLEKTYIRIKEIPFDSVRKLMTTVHKIPNGGYKIITKGAPDLLLNLCTHYRSGEKVLPLDKGAMQNLKNNNELMASKSLRTLGVAYKLCENVPNEASLEAGLIFCGFVGIIDPPRPEARYAVKECLNAGIKPVMITGDHPGTADAIAKELGILSERTKSMNGKDLDKMSQEELEKTIADYTVFSRVSPQHKVRIVKAFQANGNVVAMTGDGVNDAPALKISDIGCAMGKSGTDVAKSASDIILTDDNFATIVEAVKQGRGIFENIKKSIHFLLSTNIGEIILVLLAFILHMPSPLLAIQLLWINLVTDSFPALALGIDPVDEEIMYRNLNGTKKDLFSGGLWYSILVEGSFIGAISLLAFTIGRTFFDTGTIPYVGRTMAFAVLGLSQIIHAFNVRSERPLKEIGFLGNKYLIGSFLLCSLLQISVVTIPSLCVLFRTEQLNLIEWIIVLILSLSPFVISELEKYLIKINSQNGALKSRIKKFSSFQNV